MCGIAGVLSFAPGRLRVSAPMVTAMRDAMAHRGPDGAATWVDADGRVGLGHRRLAIIDLTDAAAQPMANAEGTLWLVFNGEIYNHAAIRAELIQLGHRDWKTDHSDTEVLLRAFEEWGIGCLDRLIGMFAFAVWDARERALWLVRDRIGIKPLYYAIDMRGVVFASEIKAILAGPERPRAVNEEGLFHFLSFLTTPAPMTLFAGINKLPAGTWMRIDAAGAVRQRKWWDPLDAPEDLGGASDAAIAERVLETLRTAVACRKVGDVPVGVFLSGGIDSSTNLALFSENETRPVHTFSIGYADDQASVADELPYARMMAERVGAHSHELKLSRQDLYDFLPRMVELQDEPIADPVCVPVYYVSKLARDHGVIVCQVGEGADELFCGYPSWKILLRLQQMDGWPVPSGLKRLGVGALKAGGRGDRIYTEWLRRGAAGHPIFWGGAEAFTASAKQRLLSPRLRDRFAGFSSWEAIAPIRRRFEEKAAETSALNWMSYMDLNMRLPELLLMRVDKMSMGTSIEARVPFLDHRLVSLVLGLPAAVKTRHGELKSLLKRAVRGLIPDAIIDRRKQGFSVPVAEWLGQRLAPESAEILRRFCRETDLLDAVALGDVRRLNPGTELWPLLNLALWWDAYIRRPS